jgi:hypothetical protein
MNYIAIKTNLITSLSSSSLDDIGRGVLKIRRQILKFALINMI